MENNIKGTSTINPSTQYGKTVDSLVKMHAPTIDQLKSGCNIHSVFSISKMFCHTVS